MMGLIFQAYIGLMSPIMYLKMEERDITIPELHFSMAWGGFHQVIVYISKLLTIDYDGNLRLHSLNYGTGLWKINWEAVLVLCEVHGICGRNGICVNTHNLPKCSCPPGYEMADPGNWNKGCKPRFNKTCSGSQQLMTFVEIPHVDLWV